MPHGEGAVSALALQQENQTWILNAIDWIFNKRANVNANDLSECSQFTVWCLPSAITIFR